ncbi:MAG: aquaporin [Verrucomicrobiales bacterium]|nr:aquaporin [Verrucomicrobiales bacterium]
MKKYLVEFIGTFFLVFSVCFAAVMQNHAMAAFGIAATLMVMIYSGGHISGGHYNPAVSLAAMLRGKLSSKDFPFYVVAQILGGVVAAFLSKYLAGESKIEAFEPEGITPMVGEFLFTFALAWVVLNVATAKGTAGNSFYGLAIGSTVLAGAIAVGKFSLGVFNPAVAFGLVVMGKLAVGAIVKYLAVQLAGGAVAGLAFNFINGKD